MVGFTPNRNGEANTLSPKTDSPFVRTLATKLKPMRPALIVSLWFASLRSSHFVTIASQRRMHAQIVESVVAWVTHQVLVCVWSVIATRRSPLKRC
jgi:hypothetical protein